MVLTRSSYVKGFFGKLNDSFTKAGFDQHARSNASKLAVGVYKNFLFLFGPTAFLLGIYAYCGNEKTWNSFIMPLFHEIDPEVAHEWAIYFAKKGILPLIISFLPENSLSVEVMGMKFDNPIGLAAGFDKNAECYSNLAELGFGFVEVGTITPLPQEGNPKPRLHRLLDHNALINRMGFNNVGLEKAINNIQKTELNNQKKFVLGINIGMNKSSENPYRDYAVCAYNSKDHCDYIVINVSSPNTPNLRDLQGTEHLKKLIPYINKQLQPNPDDSQRKKKPALILKISPDLTPDELNLIADTLMEMKGMVDGVIISNTTIERTGVLKSDSVPQGGLSGLPLKEKSNKMIKSFYEKTKGSIPIIGVGGVFTGQDAYDKIANGASLVQIYTAMTIGGPIVANRIKNELFQIMKQNNIKSVKDIIGKNCNISK